LKAIQRNVIPATVEKLSVADQTNEYLLTGLRTKWGVNREKLELLSRGMFQMAHAEDLKRMSGSGWIWEDTQSLYLTESGKLFADRIASDLFFDFHLSS
jgi:oxygen-independent coproporphyrinogen-3 oxidase